MLEQRPGFLKHATAIFIDTLIMACLWFIGYLLLLPFQIVPWLDRSMRAYSYNLVGVSPNVRKIFAAPVDKKLFFAGEAAEMHYFGTAHGAYLSGLRVADEVLEA